MRTSSVARYLSWFRPALFTTVAATYTKDRFTRDLLAGLTVGVVALPLGLAFAIASGCAPEQGLFTGIVAGFLISALGGSRFQIGGPTGAFVAIVAGIMARHGYEGLVVATLMAGVFLILMGVFGLGKLLKYIPYPVTTGFTAGIALYILSTQFREILGLATAGGGSRFLERAAFCVHHLHEVNPRAIGVTVITLLVMILVRRKIPRIPAHIVGILSATAFVQVLGLDVATIGSRFGGIPATLPHFAPPAHFFRLIPVVLPDALAVALLGGIESLLSAVVADGMTGDRHNAATELAAQGVANIASACFGGIPATGAIARTATNIRAGATSPVAGMIHAATLLFCVLFLAPLAACIPMASLAGVLMVVAWDMSEIHKFLGLMRAPAEDVAVMLITFALTVLVDLTVAVQVGVVLAALLFMRRMSNMTDFRLRRPYVEPPAADAPVRLMEGVEVYEVDGPFFFGVANRFLDVLQFLNKTPKVVILRLRHVTTIDATAAHALEMAMERICNRNIRVILSGVQPEVHDVLERMQILPRVGAEFVFKAFPDALEAARTIAAEQVSGREIPPLPSQAHSTS